MKTGIHSASILAYFLLGVSVLTAEPCDPRAYLVQDIKTITRSGETELAFVLSSTKEEFEKAKQGGGLSVFDLFSLEYTQAKQKAQRIAQAINSDYKSSYAESYFSQTTPAAAFEALKECQINQSSTPGLHLWLSDRAGDFFTLRGFWVGDNTLEQHAVFREEPTISGGEIVSKPEIWNKQKYEDVVFKRMGNEDVFIRLKVGDQIFTKVIVKDPQPVVWTTQPVAAESDITVTSTYSDPCYAGQATQCVFAQNPGGYFISNSATFTNRSTTDVNKYSEEFDYKSPVQVCGTMTQSTSSCPLRQTARGRLLALETYPTTHD